MGGLRSSAEGQTGPIWWWVPFHFRRSAQHPRVLTASSGPAPPRSAWYDGEVVVRLPRLVLGRWQEHKRPAPQFLSTRPSGPTVGLVLGTSPRYPEAQSSEGHTASVQSRPLRADTGHPRSRAEMQSPGPHSWGESNLICTSPPWRFTRSDEALKEETRTLCS